MSEWEEAVSNWTEGLRKYDTIKVCSYISFVIHYRHRMECYAPFLLLYDSCRAGAEAVLAERGEEYIPQPVDKNLINRVLKMATKGSVRLANEKELRDKSRKRRAKWKKSS